MAMRRGAGCGNHRDGPSMRAVWRSPTNQRLVAPRCPHFIRSRTCTSPETGFLLLYGRASPRVDLSFGFLGVRKAVLRAGSRLDQEATIAHRADLQPRADGPPPALTFVFGA